MGMFDNMFDEKFPARNLEPTDAFAGILLAATACDKHIADEEVSDLFSITGRMKLFQGMSEDEWNDRMGLLTRLIEREGVDKLVEKCAAILPEAMRSCAFANACDLILADGVVEEEEKTFLERLQSVLSIDGDTAMSIVEVMMIKNSG